jgi:hypothetical protein
MLIYPGLKWLGKFTTPLPYHLEEEEKFSFGGETVWSFFILPSSLLSVTCIKETLFSYGKMPGLNNH